MFCDTVNRILAKKKNNQKYNHIQLRIRDICIMHMRNTYVYLYVLMLSNYA